MAITFKTGQKIFVDTAPLIYWFEEHPDYIQKLIRFFDEITEKQIPLMTSMVTYIEVLTYPEKTGNRLLSGKYRNYFTNSDQLAIYPLNVSVADAAIRLRARHALKTPDAIQLATAQVCGCDYVLSNDRTWPGVSGIRVLLVSELSS
jgi:predicted nucleic acid-binding protein